MQALFIDEESVILVQYSYNRKIRVISGVA